VINFLLKIDTLHPNTNETEKSLRRGYNRLKDEEVGCVPRTIDLFILEAAPVGVLNSSIVPTLRRGNQCLSRSSGVYDYRTLERPRAAYPRWSVGAMR